MAGNSHPFEGAVCIRPSYVWPWTSFHSSSQQARCMEEGFVRIGADGAKLAALFSGCGPDGARTAVSANKLLLEQVATLVTDKSSLGTSTLEALLMQCHQQLTQSSQQQQQQQPPDSHNSTATDPGIDTANSGTSALLAVLGQQQQRLLVASSGLCRAVLVRSSAAGELTVMELTPYLALGHDATETARLDAAGSSIFYLPAAAAVHRDFQGTAATASVSANTPSMTNSLANVAQPDAVLVGPDDQVLAGVRASRMLGFSRAASAGVMATPVVTSWRLTGSEAFVVLGTPGLWAAMSPAEVADYTAAALAAGVGSIDADLPSAGTAAGAGSPGVSVGDLLTLEAQERLKLKLMDRLFGLCPGPASGVPCSSGVVPDVSAVVLQLAPAADLSHNSVESLDLDKQLVAAELGQVARSCHSNAGAQQLQDSWSAEGAAGCCSGPLASPPSPALRSLLPVLSVAGGTWPAAFWPKNETVSVRTPAAAAARHVSANSRGIPAGTRPGPASDCSSGKLSFEEAAAAAGLLRRSSSRSISGSGSRNSGFALCSRLSCELDLSHDHGSQGSCGCLASECNITAVGSHSEQSMILHKVRLAAPGELESLLFASATTQHPDTTVARYMRSTSAGDGPASLTGEYTSSLGRACSHAVLQRREQHHAPQRSASVLIAALNMNHTAAEHGNSSGGETSALQHAGTTGLRGSSSTHMYGHSGKVLHSMQQIPLVTVKKARSYQALSALQAASVDAASASSTTPRGQPGLLAPGSLVGSGVSTPANMSSLGLDSQQAAAATSFRSAFQRQQRAMSALPAVGGVASLAGDASSASVSMPLSCPTEGLASEFIQPGEGRVRGGVTRDNRSSSCRVSLDVTAVASAAAAAAAADDGASGASVLSNSCRDTVLQDAAAGSIEAPPSPASQTTIDTAAAAAVQHGAAAEPLAHPDRPLSAFALAAMQPVASIDTESSIASTASNHPAAVLSTEALSTPVAELASLAVQASHAAPTVSAGAAALQSGKLESTARGGQPKGSRMRAAYSTPNLPSLAVTCAAADAAYEAALLCSFNAAANSYNDNSSSSSLAANLGLNSCRGAVAQTCSVQSTSSPFSAAASTAAGGLPASITGLGRTWSSPSDGAVHGGERGNESLEGQVHNGKRSNSLTGSLSGLLPSLSGSLSPPEDGNLSTTPSHARSRALRACVSAHSSREPDIALRMKHASDRSGFVSALAPAASGPSFSTWQQQQQQVTAAEAATSPAIEVLRMPSGSFTRVRMSASAPAAAAVEHGVPGQELASTGLASVTDLAFSLNVGSSDVAVDALDVRGAGHGQGLWSHSSRPGSVRRSASSTGVAGPGLGRAAASGSWSSSRAWGASSSSSGRRSVIQFGKVQMPPAQPGPPSKASAELQQCDSADSGRSVGAREDSTAGASQGRSGADLSMMQPALHSSGARRQKSQTLPTLTESPTPGSSPQIMSNSSIDRTLDLANSSNLGDHAAKQRQQQQQAGLLLQMEEMLQEASFSEPQFVHNQPASAAVPNLLSQLPGQQQFGDAHSATKAGLAESPLASGGSLTDLLFEESIMSAADHHDHEEEDDQICPPGSPAGVQTSGRPSFEFRRHILADAMYGCSPAPVGNSAGSGAARPTSQHLG